MTCLSGKVLPRTPPTSSTPIQLPSACCSCAYLFTQDCGDITCLANKTVLSALLELCPERVLTLKELKGGLMSLDNLYGKKLSGATSRKVQEQWMCLQAEKVRAMLSYIRCLVRKSGSARSRCEGIAELKALVNFQPGSSSSSLEVHPSM